MQVTKTDQNAWMRRLIKSSLHACQKVRFLTLQPIFFFSKKSNVKPEAWCQCSLYEYIDVVLSNNLHDWMLKMILTLLLPNTTCPVLANTVDPDQLASEEVNWSESALFVIKYVNYDQKPGLNNLIGWKLEVGVAS